MTFSVLAVCLGNICRSPMIEHLLAARLGPATGSGGVEVSSAGVLAVAGSDMHPAVRQDLTTLGVEPGTFTARQLLPPMVLDADLVLTATTGVRTRVLEDVPSALRRTFTILDFAALAASAPPGLTREELVRDASERRATLRDVEHDVPDPIGQGADVFARVTAELDEATRTVAALLDR